MFGPIKTQPQLQEAILGTYLFDIVIAVVFIVALIVIANLIPWQGGKNDTSGRKRRTWYFTLMFLTLAVSLGFNYMGYFSNIGVPTFKMDYMLHMVLGAVLSAVVYGGVLYLIIIMQKTNNKLRSIFPPKA